MELTDYNNHLLNLHKDCATSSFGEMGDFYPDIVENKFNILADNFNNTIASPLLSVLHYKNKNKDLIDNLENYPYMFWKTNEGKSMISSKEHLLQDNFKNDFQLNLEKYIKYATERHYNTNYINESLNIILNEGLSDNSGEGLLKTFVKSSLMLHLSFGKDINTVDNINTFLKSLPSTNEMINPAFNTQLDFSKLPDFLKKSFKKTVLAEEINAIDFDSILQLKSEQKETNKPKM